MNQTGTKATAAAKDVDMVWYTSESVQIGPNAAYESVYILSGSHSWSANVMYKPCIDTDYGTLITESLYNKQNEYLYNLSFSMIVAAFLDTKLLQNDLRLSSVLQYIEIEYCYSHWWTFTLRFCNLKNDHHPWSWLMKKQINTEC